MCLFHFVMAIVATVALKYMSHCNANLVPNKAKRQSPRTKNIYIISAKPFPQIP